MTIQSDPERGSSTLEFIFCAPLLLIVMFVAMEINERIEQRVTSTIAAGNLLWTASPESSFDTARLTQLQDLAKADILGTRAVGTPSVLGVDAAVEANNTLMSYTPEHRHADAYQATILRQANAASSQAANQRARASIGNGPLDGPAQAIARAATTTINVADALMSPRSSWIPSVIPAHDIEQQQLIWSVSEQGTTNVAIQAIEGLATAVNRQSPGFDTGAIEARLLAHHSRYLRRYGAYHMRSEDYQNEALLALGLGFFAGNRSKFDDFVDYCFMKFAGDVCGQKNGFYSEVKTIHSLVATGKTLVDTATYACIMASLGFGSGTCNIPQIAYKLAESQLENVVENTIEGIISDTLEKALKEAQTKAMNELVHIDVDQIVSQATGSIANAVNEHAGRVLDGVGGEETP